MKRGIAQITDAVWGIGLLLSVFAVIIIPLSNWAIDQTRATIAATHAKRVQEAVNSFIKDNHVVIASSATASTPYVFGVNNLISGGYLPSGFSTQNGFSATYETRVFEPSADKLSSMTYLIGGVDISKSLARKIAIGIGADGGIINGSVAEGSLGSWTINLSSFGGYNPGDGSVVIAGFYNDGVKINDYLYRKAVPGHPELNTMSTSLNLGNNNITNASTTTTIQLNANDVSSTNVTAQNVNSTNVTATNVTGTNVTGSNVNGTNVNATTTRTAGETYTGGWFRTTGDAGWYSEKYGGGIYMTDWSWVRIYNDKGLYTGGQIQGGTIQSNGRLTANEYIQINGGASAGSGCAPNGLIGRDGNGAILNCQSGVWRMPGGKPRQTQYTYTNYATSYNYMSLGVHDICTSLYGNENDRSDSWRGVESLADGTWRIVVKDGSETALCLDW